MEVDSYGVVNGVGRVGYKDGSEQRVLDTLLATRDLADGSDELTAQIVDWPTRYHFSPMRSNLLRPLAIGVGDRILEIGCGSGVLTRWLGEQGALVTAYEGSIERSRAASTRCADLKNVTVVCGTTDDLPGGELYDLVIVVGVLEHVAGEADGVTSPNLFLAECARNVTPDGALVLAIENQLGLKYILGYNEDHQGLPWIGCAGYPRGGPRTWSRVVLTSMIESHGFAYQHWLYPFPDYKLPVVIVSESLYRHPSAPQIIDQFVRHPATEDAGQATFVCDPRGAHRVMLEAGLGPDVANSFLVIARRNPDAPTRLVGDHLAWYFGTERLRPWRRERALTESNTGELHLVTDRSVEPERGIGWLQQVSHRTQPVHIGQPLDRLLEAALSARQLDDAKGILILWIDGLVRVDATSGVADTVVIHPFSPIDGEPSLQSDHLDIGPSNFVMTTDGLRYVDAEWRASGPVSFRLAVIRALWYLASEYMSTAASTPWGSTVSVDLLCLHLAALAGVGGTPLDLQRFRSAEAVLLEMVTGKARQDIEIGLVETGKRRPIDVSARNMPVASLRAAIENAREDCRSIQEELEHERALLGVARLELSRLLSGRSRTEAN